MPKFIAMTLGILSLALLPQASEAGVITGTLDIGGAITVTNTGVIDFGSNGGTTGVLAVQPTSTFLDGATLVNSGTATEKDLTDAAQPTSGFAPLNQWETLSAIPTINFILLDINSCAEIGGICAAGATSPFSFAQTNIGDTTVTMRMTGTVFDSLTPSLISTWVGIFTAQFPGQTIGNLLSQLQTSGFIDTSVSASKVTTFQQTSTVPEPASLFLLGAGAAIFARTLRKRARAIA
jgi:hypothetical protein